VLALAQVHVDAAEEAAAERMQEINKAYEILSDPQKREVYDMTGSVENAEKSDAGFGSGGFGFSDIFAILGDIHKTIDVKIIPIDRLRRRFLSTGGKRTRWFDAILRRCRILIDKTRSHIAMRRSKIIFITDRRSR
jgi:DnaJ-class molecular chaperone